MPNRFVRHVRAFETETVEVRWVCEDGSEFHQRMTVPPKATRDAVLAGRAVLRAGVEDLQSALVSWGDTREKTGP